MRRTTLGTLAAAVTAVAGLAGAVAPPAGAVDLPVDHHCDPGFARGFPGPVQAPSGGR